MSSELSVSTQSADIPELSREEIQQRLHDPTLILVDVLPRETYAAGHIPGALSLPVAEIPVHAREVLPDRAAEITVYCARFT
ncbi:MAG: rhodanese-like domain-containing protein [Deltaproteobacteria bacterium]|nr:rhodanese-like domain-containing protein [Deltaproteobacteria bacterium]